MIGADNALPWRLPADLKRFRKLTSGHAVLMGRKTWESLGKPLADRTNLILSANPDYAAPEGMVVSSIDGALAAAQDAVEIFVIGGASVYEQMLPLADRFYLTLVHTRVAGDTWFPQFDRDEWQELERQIHDADESHAYAFSFVTLERKCE